MGKLYGIPKWAAVAIVFSSQAQAAPTPLNWEDCFQAAVKRSETVADQDELILQANEKHSQAVGSVLPNISGVGTYFDQGAPSVANSIATPVQRTVKLTGTQYLFQGFREYAGLRQTNDTIAATVQTKKRTLVQLYQAVSTAFYQVLAAEKDIYNLQSETKLYEKQIEQLEKWVKIGRSRPADVTQTQSQQATLLATLEVSRDQLNTARETLAYLTGLDRDLPLQDPFPSNFDPGLGLLPDYVAAVDRRPEVLAATFNRDAADEGVAIAKGGHLPSVQVNGDYYAIRTGGIPGGSWDFTLGVTLPIFSGGVIQSQVRVAASQYHESELFVSQDQRLASQEIRTYYERVHDDQNQVRSYSSAKDISWVNYQQEMHDYHLGLVTNLDVLQSLTTFTTNERTLDQVKFQERIDYLYLQAATGKTKDIPY
jgi:outer membrane protein